MKTREAINGKMLILARQAKGLTQTDLARKTGIPIYKLSRFENGLSKPSVEVMDTILGELERPLSFFTRDEEIYPPGLSIYHRKRKSLPKRHAEKIDAWMNIQRQEIFRIIDSVDIPDLNIPFFELGDIDGGPEEAAEQLRLYWQLPMGPIDNIVDLIEGAGAIVVSKDFETDRIDAETMFIRGKPPVIFVNKRIPGCRQRMSLAHELAHIILHRLPHQEMEREADQFAGAFLMPAREIKPMLKPGLTIQTLAELKPYWRTSMQAILVRASTLRRITASRSTTMWKALSARGYRKREPVELDIPYEHPSLLNEIIQSHFEDLGYSVESLAELLDYWPQEFLSVYLSSNNQIRLAASNGTILP